MDLIPVDDLSVKIQNAEVAFGILLPEIFAAEGYRVFVKIIHEHEQFLQDVPAIIIELEEKPHQKLNEYGPYWHGKIDITSIEGINSTHWGTPGKYLYRFALESPGSKKVDWIVDPFARNFGMGKQSSFTIGGNGSFSWTQITEEKKWKIPKLDELIVYEMMIHEFIGDFNKSMRMLDYLADMGVNALQVMPLTNLERMVNWGHDPVSYFGVHESLGGSNQLKLFVAEAHRRGIAIIADLICGHVSYWFPYVYIYESLGFSTSKHPFFGSYGDRQFPWGRKANYQKKFVQDFFFTVCNFWIERFHIDGIRYGYVPEFYERHDVYNKGFSNLVYSMHERVRSKKEDPDWSRFFFDGEEEIRLVQCAEYPDCPEEILEKSYSNCVWQEKTLQAAKDVSLGREGAIIRFGRSLSLAGFPEEKKLNGQTMKSSAYQYIESHDHSRFICNFELINQFDDNIPRHELVHEGDRALWYKVQPYLIALFASKGIPMLWQGQELMDNYCLPSVEWGSLRALRPLRWDYFYDDPGRQTVALVRKLIRLRKNHPQLYKGEFIYNESSEDASRGIMVFKRILGDHHTVIALNFTDQDVKFSCRFDYSGIYEEGLTGKREEFKTGQSYDLIIPSQYGQLWCTEGKP